VGGLGDGRGPEQAVELGGQATVVAGTFAKVVGEQHGFARDAGQVGQGEDKVADGQALAALRTEAAQAVEDDEAHVVAPQRGSYPDAIKKAAKVGRGEGLSTLWITQELQDIDNRIIGMWTDTILGGFKTESALDKLPIEYPQEVHNLNIPPSRCPTLPDELRVDGESIPLRLFEDDHGSTIGSEWVYSRDGGEIERVDTRDVDMQSTHYGSEGHSLTNPDAGHEDNARSPDSRPKTSANERRRSRKSEAAKCPGPSRWR
jgi:hypothetical protein